MKSLKEILQQKPTETTIDEVATRLREHIATEYDFQPEINFALNQQPVKIIIAVPHAAQATVLKLNQSSLQTLLGTHYQLQIRLQRAQAT